MEDHQSTKKPRRGPYGKNEKSDSLVTDINMSDYDFTMTTESIDKTLQMSFDESIDEKHLEHSPHCFNETSTCGFSKSNENCGTELDSKESTSKIMESEVFSEERYKFDLKQSVEAEMKSGDPDLDELLALIQRENEHLLPDDGDVLDIDSDDDLRLDGLSEKADHDELDSQPLYPGAAVSVGAFMLLLAVFTTKYNLTGDATQQLLYIIAFALPSGHMLCTKLNEFKHFFKNLRNPLVYHYYCDNCLGYIGDNSVKVCPYDFCRANFNTKQAAYFLEIPLEKQIQNLFAQDGFYESLEYPFKRNVADDIYEDIYDGKLYKSLLKDNGILSFQENLSFTFNTDGAPVFKSSKVSVWPIYLVISELTYKQRMRKENTILARLWFGNKKPSMGMYLKPLQQSMKKPSQGIKCTSPNIGCFDIKAILLCGTADLPARSMLCNHVQYNGAFSCWKCEQEGISAAVGKGHARVFPYKSGMPKGPARTEESVLEQARLAVNMQNEGSKKDKSIRGIKGPSWLIFFPFFNIVSGIAIDYMHGVLLGVQKMLLELWFDQKHKNKPYNFHQKVCEVDERLQSIRPILDITRLPRSIEKDLKFWKASEYRSFLLFYGAPVLLGILDKERFSHFLLLVDAMHILLKYGSCNRDIDQAETMLMIFVSALNSYTTDVF